MGRPLDFAAMPPSRSHPKDFTPRFPLWAEVIMCVFVLATLAAAYVLVMHLAIDDGAQANGESTNGADVLYFGLHGIVLAAATASAVALAIWMRRSAFALATLAAAWLVTVMLLAQVATFHLACEGTNDIIRHWQCQAEPADE